MLWEENNFFRISELNVVPVFLAAAVSQPSEALLNEKAIWTAKKITKELSLVYMAAKNSISTEFFPLCPFFGPIQLPIITSLLQNGTEL